MFLKYWRNTMPRPRIKAQLKNCFKLLNHTQRSTKVVEQEISAKSCKHDSLLWWTKCYMQRNIGFDIQRSIWWHHLIVQALFKAFVGMKRNKISRKHSTAVFCFWCWWWTLQGVVYGRSPWVQICMPPLRVTRYMCAPQTLRTDVYMWRGLKKLNRL